MSSSYSSIPQEALDIIEKVYGSYDVDPIFVPISKEIWDMKYRYNNEHQFEFFWRIANATMEDHIDKLNFFKHLIQLHGFPAGRILYGVGTDRKNVTFSNCYVIPVIHDSMIDIMETAKNAALVMKAGGGLGYNFSVLRPSGATIKTSGEQSTGPISFMGIFDALTKTIKAGGNRRGANMGGLDIWHPDIPNYIQAKRDGQTLTQFNISIVVNDKFMKAVENDEEWEFIYPDINHPKYDEIWGSKKLEEFYNWFFEHPFEDINTVRNKYNEAIKDSLNGNIYKWIELGLPIKSYGKVKARELYDDIMRSNYNFAEPGVIYIDTMNKYNNLNYIEDIRVTNPCITGDTLVAVADGRNAAPVKDLVNEGKFPVYSARFSKVHKKWVTEVKWATAFKTGRKKIVEIKLSNGSSFRCTEDHLLAIKGQNKYVEAKNSKGLVLEKFYAFFKTYRYINSKSNAYNRQYRLIWEFLNGEYDGKKFSIHHKDHDTTNDLIENLDLVSKIDHDNKHHSISGDNNPVFRMDKEYFRLLNKRRNILGNAKRYNWDDERLQNELDKFDNSYDGRKLKELKEFIDRENNKEYAKLEYLQKDVYVVDVIELNEYSDVYDLNVEDNHNFYIITKTYDDKYLDCEGVLIHNCGEQPLFSYGSCNLGSINLSTLVKNPFENESKFDWENYKSIIKYMVKCLDKVLDINYYPLKEQEAEVILKRPIGLGVTGLADCLVMLGLKYSSEEGRNFVDELFTVLKNESYKESVNLAKKKGSFPLFDRDKFLNSEFVKNLDEEVKDMIYEYGIRNARILSIAPTGTISFSLGNNCSSGIEPIYNLQYVRKIKQSDGSIKEEKVRNYAYELFIRKFGEDTSVPHYFETAYTLSVDDHIEMQAIAQKHIDTSISKTINVPQDYPFEDFKKIYIEGWKLGLKGTTTYRPNDVIGSVFSYSEEMIDEYFFKYEGETDEEARQRFRRWFGLDKKDEKKEKLNENLEKYKKVIANDKINKALDEILENIKYIKEKELRLLPLESKQKVVEIARKLGINPQMEKELLDEEDSIRYRVLWKGIKVYIIISHDEKGCPVEVFAQLPQEAGFNGSGDFRPELFLERLSYWHSICRLLSLLFRYDIPLDEVIKQLRKSSYNITHLSSILARLLSRYPLRDHEDVEELEEEIIIDEYNDNENCDEYLYDKLDKYADEIESKRKCPVCESDRYFIVEGCYKCMDCGYSKCG